MIKKEWIVVENGFLFLMAFFVIILPLELALNRFVREDIDGTLVRYHLLLFSYFPWLCFSSLAFKEE
jgi:hypothetical protein